MKTRFASICLLLFLKFNLVGQGLPPYVRNPMSTNPAVSVPLNLEVPRWNGTAWDFVTVSASSGATSNLIQSLTSTNGYFIYTVTANGNTNAFFVITNAAGNGNGLTNLNAAFLALGFVPLAQLPPVYSTNAFGLSVSNSANTLGSKMGTNGIFTTGVSVAGGGFAMANGAMFSLKSTTPGSEPFFYGDAASGMSLRGASASFGFQGASAAPASSQGLTWLFKGITLFSGNVSSSNLILTLSGTAVFSVAGGQGISSQSGVASYRSNLLASATITVGASPFLWTNTFGVSVNAFVDGVSVTGTIGINGGTIFNTIGQCTVPLQPNEYMTVTYTIGTPTATWRPL